MSTETGQAYLASSVWLFVLVTAGAYAWLPVAVLLGMPMRVALAAALLAPIAVWRITRAADHRDPAAFERLTFFAVFLLVGTSAAELVGFAL